MGPFTPFEDEGQTFIRCETCGRVGLPKWAHLCRDKGNNFYETPAALRAGIAPWAGAADVVEGTEAPPDDAAEPETPPEDVP